MRAPDAELVTVTRRQLPEIDDENEHYWRGGALGRLLIQRCVACRLWIHPPSPVCRRCHSRAIVPEPVSGRGTVFTYTVNHHRWREDMEVPFAVASVELAEQANLRVTTEIVGCPPAEVRAGMVVQVRFLELDDVWLPQFAPSADVPEVDDR
jgi:uncharacterized OB-fold protein